MKIVPEKGARRFEGWGSSLCWWANRIGYSDELSQKAAELFYGDDGLRLNIMRYNIGGGDDPSHRHITRTDSAIPGWMDADGVYDYTADNRQLNVLKRCCEAAGELAWVEVFSNSPPYFMTVSGCSSGGEDPNVDNLRQDCYENFAEYLSRVTEYINNVLEIKVKSVSPMNEPNTSHWWKWNWKQEGCHFDAESHSRILSETARAFRRHGLGDVIIAGSDEYSPQNQIIAYNAYTDEVKSIVGRISTHTYDTADTAELGALAKSEGFNLWMSEVDGGDTVGEDAGEMGAALWLAKKIISDINSLYPTAWVLWQVIDNHICADGFGGNKDKGMPDLSGGYWGLAVADHNRGEIILTKKYYGFGQFTRYIRPGCRLIRCDGDTLAAYDGESVTIVAVNDNAGEKAVEYDLSAFSVIGGVRVIRTDREENWKELENIPVTKGVLAAKLKGNSITTFIIHGGSVWKNSKGETR